MVRTQSEIDASGDRALSHYHERIKPQLTTDDVNRFIAIDPISGEWGVSDDEDAAVGMLREKVDVEHPLVIVHPRIWVDSFGGWRTDTST